MKRKILTTIIFLTLIFPFIVSAARTQSSWLFDITGYIFPAQNPVNILISGTNRYLNFGTFSGTSGYGFRDNSGTMEFKNSGGSWTGIGSGGGGANTIANGNTATTTGGYTNGVEYFDGTKITNTNALLFPTLSGIVPTFGNYQTTNNVLRLGHSFQNFLTNASFEYWLAGTSVAPTGWTLQGATAVRSASNESTTFSYSAVVTFTNADDQIRQSITATSSVPFTLSVWMKRTSGSGTVNLIAQEDGGAFTEYASNGCAASSTQFSLCQVSFTKPADGVNNIRFKVAQQGATGSVWEIDEAMMQEGLNLATAWLPAYLDDTSDGQSIYGSKNFLSKIGIGTTTPSYLLNPFSSTAPQLALSAGAGISQWAFRNAGGNLYFATTTVVGTATSSVSALKIDSNGKVTANCFTNNGSTCIAGVPNTLTPGSVLFSNGTTIAQDNSNFFWDNTNKYLGINTNTPSASIQIGGYSTLFSPTGVDTVIADNTYNNAGWKMLNTGVGAVQYMDNTGAVSWYRTTGTAGGTATLTAMLGLSASGLDIKGSVIDVAGVPTIGSGVPITVSEYHSASPETADIGSAFLYTDPGLAGIGGKYRACARVILTTADTIASTMPIARVMYTDVDTGGFTTLEITPSLGTTGMGQNALLTDNVVGDSFAGCEPLYVTTASSIFFDTNGFTNTATDGAYVLRLDLEYIGPTN